MAVAQALLRLGKAAYSISNALSGVSRGGKGGQLVVVEVLGAQEALANLRKLGGRIERTVVRKALGAALKPMVGPMRAAVPFQGLLGKVARKSIGSEVKKSRRQGWIGLVGPRTDAKYLVSHYVPGTKVTVGYVDKRGRQRKKKVYSKGYSLKPPQKISAIMTMHERGLRKTRKRAPRPFMRPVVSALLPAAMRHFETHLEAGFLAEASKLRAKGIGVGIPGY